MFLTGLEAVWVLCHQPQEGFLGTVSLDPRRVGGYCIIRREFRITSVCAGGGRCQEAEEGKATEALVQSPGESLAGQEIACSPLHSFLEAKVETECIGRGGGGEEVRRQIRANGCNARCVGEQRRAHLLGPVAGRVDGGGRQGICLHV
jgi:hypothetical protein